MMNRSILYNLLEKYRGMNGHYPAHVIVSEHGWETLYASLAKPYQNVTPVRKDKNTKFCGSVFDVDVYMDDRYAMHTFSLNEHNIPAFHGDLYHEFFHPGPLDGCDLCSVMGS